MKRDLEREIKKAANQAVREAVSAAQAELDRLLAQSRGMEVEEIRARVGRLLDRHGLRPGNEDLAIIASALSRGERTVLTPEGRFSL